MAKPEPPAPPADATRVLVRMPPERIVEFHAILEGYDDLALVRTVAAAEGLVELWVTPGREGELERLLEALAREGLPAALAAQGGGR